ncbi:MAG: pyridoxamine 5'-phosphate oxidase family protein [Lachnospiraceae bacterium]|nr:pyridoxamine 5'-phosphate oxidase family protein [Lachnospiraceae bacterium]
MRRKDRQVTDITELKNIIESCKVCRIGMIDEQGVYIVPLNFGYEFVDEQLKLYFHCAKEGRKLSAIAANPSVCVEMDCEHQLVEGDIACEYGYRFASVIGNGNTVIVEDIEEKKHGLSVLMRHQTGKDFAFEDAQTRSVAVVRIDVEAFTGKRKQ